ncbi:MAG: Nif3-like dinuclear metal center hexameric protein [Phycisphaerales bacterium]|nr:Nif3-like dinuclear metal center hexameric protein [Phycisphaerales bacterium]
MKAKSRHRSTVNDLCTVMEEVAPTWAAADWDNVGLLVGHKTWPVRRVLLCIDLTAAVLDEATRGRFDVILAYHPPIFRPVKRMTPDRSEQEGLAAAALSSRIAIYSPHTALDAAPGGTNDTLAAMAGLRDVIPFEAAGSPMRDCKLVVFVPEAQADGVAEAVFEAGAGRIGDYERCSYRLRGQGTFWGMEGANPTVGRKGRLERVDEMRLEVIFPQRRLVDVAAAVRRSHPYEEPAFDIYPLEKSPDGRIGQGRIGYFSRPPSLRMLASSLAKKTRAANVTIVGKPGQKVRRGLVCVGAAGSLPFEIPGKPCGAGDVILTGEIRHHDALRYQRAGAAAIALGHWASERPVLTSLAARLRRAIPRLSAVVSRKDCDPFGPV